MIYSNPKIVTLAFLIIFLTACGGGSSSSDSSSGGVSETPTVCEIGTSTLGSCTI